jgi:hypothetical protein
VQVRPGQSRSGQAGSECCLSSGDRRVRSVHSKEAGREDSAPKSFSHRDADAVSLAEGSIQMTDDARLFGVAGVPSPGHAFKWIPREPRRTSYLSRTGCGSAQPKWNQVPRDVRVAHGKRTNPRRGEPAAEGDQRWQARVGKWSYEPIVPAKVENRRAPERGGHGSHWREGANRSTYRHSAAYTRLRTRESMSNGT